MKAINLAKAKKARARAEKQRQAAANSAANGRTKAEKAADERRAARARGDLDGKRFT